MLIPSAQLVAFRLSDAFIIKLPGKQEVTIPFDHYVKLTTLAFDQPSVYCKFGYTGLIVFKLVHSPLRLMNYFPPYHPFPTGETLEASRYAIGMFMEKYSARTRSLVQQYKIKTGHST